MPEPLCYTTGEEIRKGDRVRFHGHQAKIDFPASDVNDLEHVWFVLRYGGGVMVQDPSVAGSTFIPVDQLKNYEELEFVARADGENSP
jgi:hypothetical protein